MYPQSWNEYFKIYKTTFNRESLNMQITSDIKMSAISDVNNNIGKIIGRQICATQVGPDY